MKELIRGFRLDIVCHYLEGYDWDLNINPDWTFEGRKYSPEEELILTMYIQEEMPYLELYEEFGETKVRKIDKVSDQDQLLYYRFSYNELRKEHNNFHTKIQNALEGY